MAAKLGLYSPTTTFLAPSSQSPLYPLSFTSISPKRRANNFKVHADLGGGDAEPKKGGKKKFITREQEPEQYWQTAGEREGENPMMTPLPYIIIFGMSTPFVILAIGFANGWIKGKNYPSLALGAAAATLELLILLQLNITPFSSTI